MSQDLKCEPVRDPGEGKISRPICDLAESEFDVVVVGSGYGGSIAASRMARAGFKVCLLERGREIRPGQYPEAGLKAMGNVQVDTPWLRFGSNTALYDLRLNRDIHVFVGCGLGGTSLVNANVALRADLRVFKSTAWPKELRKNSNLLMSWAYCRAEEMLGSRPYPRNRSLPKLNALKRSAKEFKSRGGRFYRPPINVTFRNGLNHAGVYQCECNDCGDCVSGCNVGAKNTTLMNYLPDAVRHGARIYTEVKVDYVERKDDKWGVRIRSQSGDKVILADIVILAAGTLGSTEILLRSKDNGLALSSWLGHRFTGNGDALGVAYNTDTNIEGIGRGHLGVTKKERVGPTIAGIIDLRECHQPLAEAMVIEDGAIPAPLAYAVNWLLPFVALYCGLPLRRSFDEFIRQIKRALFSLLRGPYTGATRNTQTYLVMSHDDVGGRMFLERDRLRVSWPHVGDEWNFQNIDEALNTATQPLGGIYLKDPIWTKDFGMQLITVHPLGGCVMGDCAERGVVNHKGLVFAGTTGSDVHRGLYVCDGSTIPTSLGVNPLLTISALAERCCRLIARDYGRRIDYRKRRRPSSQIDPSSISLRAKEINPSMPTHVSAASIVNSFPPFFGVRRNLKFNALERIDFAGEDGTALVMHHINGGDRGPVLITPGTAMTALTYCIDTLPCNFAEFLFQKGFDVWLFDWRTSPLLGAHERPYTLDDVAKFDWPAAVAQVRSRTGREQVAVLAHCLSSPAFMLSLVRGYLSRDDISAFIASQVGLHLDLIPAETLKLQARLDWVLPGGNMIHEKLSQWSCQIPDFAISLLAIFPALFWPCGNPSCYRHAATFGGLFFHPRINLPTHEMVGEIVPECLTAFLKDIASLVRRGCVLSDEDFNHLDRLLLPITFISGSENRMFIPEGTARTFELLCATNGPEDYQRKVYPGFGHLDCFFGDGARTEIWPDLAKALEMKAKVDAPPAVRTIQPRVLSGRKRIGRKKTLGVAFQETMSGGFKLKESGSGNHESQTLSLISAVSILDLDSFIKGEAHIGHINGSITYPPFGKTIFSKRGAFNLFSSTSDPQLKLIVYEMTFEHDAQDLYLIGRKELRNGPISNLWKQTTTLFVTLHQGSDQTDPVIGDGVLSVSLLELVKTISTMHAVNDRSVLEAIEAPLRYELFFIGELLKIYRIIS